MRNRFLGLQGKFREGSLDCGYPNLVSDFRGEVHLSIYYIRLGWHCLKTLPEAPDYLTGKKRFWLLLFLFIHRILQMYLAMSEEIINLGTRDCPRAKDTYPSQPPYPSLDLDSLGKMKR